MFTQKIVDSDAFLDMPLSAQALYFHLNMRADDDGFINNAKNIRRMVGASEDDLKLLMAKRFLITFDNGVVVIKHWRMHNAIRKDRYKPTQYQKQLASLDLKDNGSYTEKDLGNQLATNWQPNDNQWLPQDRLGKVRLGEDRVGEERINSGGGDNFFLSSACAHDVQDFFNRFFGREASEYELEQIRDAIHNSHHIIGEVMSDEFTYGDNDRELLQIAVEAAARANKTNVAYIIGCFRNFWQRGIVDGVGNEDYELGVRV